MKMAEQRSSAAETEQMHPQLKILTRAFLWNVLKWASTLKNQTLKKGKGRFQTNEVWLSGFALINLK